MVAELMKKIGEIEGDERALQKETQAIADKQQAETEKRLKGQLDEFIKKEGEKSSGSSSAWRRADRRARDGAGRGGQPGARQRQAAAAAAGRARSRRGQGRGRSGGEQPGARRRALDEMAAGAPRAPPRRRRAERDKTGEALGEARALAQEIADDLAKLMPRPSETLTPAGARSGPRPGREAGGHRQAHRRGRRRGGARLGKMPGMEKAEGELKGAAARMRQAAEALSATNRRGPPPPSATPPTGWRSCAIRCRSVRWGAAARAATRYASRAPTIDRPARLAAGAARRHEREGARALPRRRPPLLRGAGAMKRRRPVRRLSGLPSPGPSDAFGLAAESVVAARSRCAPPAQPPGARLAAAPPAARSTRCWTPGGSARRTPRWRRCRRRRPARPRPATSTATASSCAATTTARSAPSAPLPGAAAGATPTRSP